MTNASTVCILRRNAGRRTAVIYAAHSLGLGFTSMIGLDAEAGTSEFGLAEDVVPAMTLPVRAELPENWPQKPRQPVNMRSDLSDSHFIGR